MTRYTYDGRCWDLADHFLYDVEGSTHEDRAALAQEIQRTIEGFCAECEAALSPLTAEGEGES